MAKTAFVASMVLILLGIGMLSFGLLIQALLPKIGYIIFKFAGGSYSGQEYDLGPAIWAHHVIAVTCIVGGAIVCRRLYKDT